ncbi:MAG: ABC transporter ATP-binding protein [Chloroflexi bacterium]|nr:MAG: ABC transporter ATP-binding protein [Chloroflexota bacterium]
MKGGFSPRGAWRKSGWTTGCSTSTWGGPSVLQVTDLRAGYGSTPVLTGVNLQVTILWNGGQEISKLPTHVRARLGLAYVPQGRDIFPGLTVHENLRLGGMAARQDGTRRLQEVLKLFPMLSEKLSARGASLSGGQQQLVALARALVSAPKVLLLDEPSEGIQPSILEQIVERIRTINRQEGVAVLLVEQNLQFAAALAERAYIMTKGVVVRELPMARIVDDPEIQREYMGV